MHGVFRDEVSAANRGRNYPCNRRGQWGAGNGANTGAGQERGEPGDSQGGTTLREGLEQPALAVGTHGSTVG